MWSFREKKDLCSLSDMYPDRTNLNCIGPSHLQFTADNKLYNNDGYSYLRNYDLR